MHEPMVSRRDLRVEWGDCDPADIVYYPNYFRWFDVSTANHFHHAGLPKQDLIRKYGVVGIPMVDTRARFLVPSRHGDEISIETRIAGFGRSSFEVEHKIFRGTDLAVEGYEKRVLVGRSGENNGLTAWPIPEDVKRRFFK